jgi:AcrR family transcriptional regulator
METGLRERKKERTRQELMRSALDQFAARGFEQVTVEDIAGACDVSPRTFFRYFSSKEDVLFAESDRSLIALLDALAHQPPDVPVLLALQHAVCALADNYEHQKIDVRLRHEIILATPALRTRVGERHQGWEAAVIDQLRLTGHTAGMSELDVRLVVAAAMTALRVAISHWSSESDDRDLTSLIDATYERLRQGL